MRTMLVMSERKVWNIKQKMIQYKTYKCKERSNINPSITQCKNGTPLQMSAKLNYIFQNLFFEKRSVVPCLAP